MNATLHAITFDCVDAAGLARFWSAVLGRPVDGSGTEEFAAVGIESATSGVPGLMFVKVPEAKATKNRVQVDLAAPDLAAEVERLLVVGATHVADRDDGGARWTTLANPEGNELDVVAAGS
jgi:predicted enzyme related to lactoylglutathione lyase